MVGAARHSKFVYVNFRGKSSIRDKGFGVHSDACGWTSFQRSGHDLPVYMQIRVWNCAKPL